MTRPPRLFLRFQTQLISNRICLSLIVGLLSASVTLGQGSGRSTVGTGGIHIVQGYIFFPSGRRAEGSIQVKLQSYASGELSVMADSSGAFMFTSLAPGTYTVVVEAGPGYEIARETVMIDSDVSNGRLGTPMLNASRRYSLMIHLEPKKAQARTKPAVLDASLATVPEKPRKLYLEGLDLSRSGDVNKAVESFKTAVLLFPDFTLALNELGVQYLKLGMAAKAVEALSKAVKLDPDSFGPKLNLGIALLEAKQFSEAQVHLSSASKQNPSAPIPHMYLGITSVHLGNDVEAEKELLSAVSLSGDRLGLAHYYLGGLYWKLRNYSRAVEELEKYLQQTPGAADEQRVRNTIKELRKKL